MLKKLNVKLLSIFFFSVTLIYYELYVMRAFSVGNWSNFGALVISTALLGFGIAGTLVTFILKKINESPNKWLSVTSIAFIPAMILGHILAQAVPFAPIFIGEDMMQIFWIGSYYLIFGVPFFIGALYISVFFIAMSSRVRQVYFWNMLGSGLGGLVLLVFMYILPTQMLLLPLIVTGALASLFTLIRQNQETGKISIPTNYIPALITVVVLSIVGTFAFGKIHVSQYKDVSYVQKFADSKLRHKSYSPIGEFQVYESSSLHFLPGLSDNAYLEISKMPEQPFWALYVNGNGPTGIMGALKQDELEYLNYLPNSIPYKVLKKPDVLLIHLSGGIGVQNALFQGVGRLAVVENNPELIKLLKNDPVITKFNGNFLNDPRIELHEGEARAFCSTNKNTFDLIEISLADAVGLSTTGGYSVDENFTYTKEAIRDYLKSLKDGGMLSITVWNKLKPPRNIPRLITTIVAALKSLKVADPSQHLVSFDLLNSTATILVKKTAFTANEVDVLKDAIARKSFNPVYFPGIATDANIPAPTVTLDDILRMYSDLFTTRRIAKEDAGKSFTPSVFYRFIFEAVLSGGEKKLYKDYIFDIHPMTDDKPYYATYLKTGSLGLYTDQLSDVSEEWGFIMNYATLIESLIFAAIIILMPMIGRWKDLFSGKKGTLGVIVYFACLGLGYMLVEIFLMQRLSYYLGDPVFSTSIVITAMLILSAIGGLLSSRLSRKRSHIVRIASTGVVLSLLFFVFALTPIINATLNWPFLVKMLLTIVLIAPVSFFLGMPFPNGLDALSESKPRLLPWAWGMNGALSVTGSVLCRIFSISFGFTFVLLAAAVVYTIVGLIFKANENA